MVSPSIEFLEGLAVACGEELVLDARAREVPVQAGPAERQARDGAEDRVELPFSWNKLAGELTLAGARARGERS